MIKNSQLAVLSSNFSLQRTINVNKVLNLVYENFFFPDTTTSDYVSFSNEMGWTNYLERKSDSYDVPLYMTSIFQGEQVLTTKWKQKYLSDFLSDLGGLFTSVMGVLTFFISGYQSFVHDKSMIKKLYGEQRQNTTFSSKDENLQ